MACSAASRSTQMGKASLGHRLDLRVIPGRDKQMDSTAR